MFIWITFFLVFLKDSIVQFFIRKVKNTSKNETNLKRTCLDTYWVCAKIYLLHHVTYVFRIRIPNVNEGHPLYSTGRTLSINLVYTIWAVFGGFILHFLLSRYLTVLLKQGYEEPVDTAADLIRRDITPILPRSYTIYVQIFANSPDPIYQELSRKLYICKTRKQYLDYFGQMKDKNIF